MSKTETYRTLALRALCAALCCASSAAADVNLQWRPLNQSTSVGQIVEIGLFAVSDNTNPQYMASLGIILIWDPVRLELIGINPDNDGYMWLNSFFPDDRALDAINDDCDNGTFCSPFTARPVNDGDAYYEAWGQFSPAPPPQAVPGPGLLVTKFQFRALRSGTGRLQFAATFGDFTHTRVLSGIVPGREITGTLGPAAQVAILPCGTLPAAAGNGSRYLAVTPSPTDDSVAIWIGGDESDPAVDCVGGYVQDDGRLGEEAVFHAPEDWGTVHVSDARIIPSTLYRVHTDCGSPGSPDLAPGVDARTWTWGDVDQNGLADGDDLLRVLDASTGFFQGVTLQNVNLAGCTPDGVINADDILSVLDALQALPYPCPSVCTIAVDLADWAAFVPCFAGPGVPVAGSCTAANLAGGIEIDLGDVAEFQNSFQPVSGP